MKKKLWNYITKFLKKFTTSKEPELIEEKYRIQRRKYSSNVLEAKRDGSWTPCLAPLFMKKEEGDKLCEKLLIYLQNE